MIDGTDNNLPPIPDKRYFTIGETSILCGIKPHVLRYWEQEFPQLRPSTRRGNRRYYQHKDVMLVREIRRLLYEQGFTISGARQQFSQLKKQVNAPVVPSVVPVAITLPTSAALNSGDKSFLAEVCAALESVANNLSQR